MIDPETGNITLPEQVSEGLGFDDNPPTPYAYPKGSDEDITEFQMPISVSQPRETSFTSEEVLTLVNQQLIALLNPVRNAIDFEPFYLETELRSPMTEGTMKLIHGGECEIPPQAADAMKARLLGYDLHVAFPETTDPNDRSTIRIKLRAKGSEERLVYKIVAPWYVELYCAQPTTSTEITEILQAVCKANAPNHLIFRGEHDLYPSVRSTMARAYNTNSQEALSIIVEDSLTAARQYLPKEQHDDISVSAVIQHMGGRTNLVDFSTESWIALFFACLDARSEQRTDKTGRVYALNMDEANQQMEFHSLANRQSPVQQERWKNQHGVAVIPPNGMIAPNLLTEVARIPSNHKAEVNRFLDNIGISTKTMFNDIGGYIAYEQDMLSVAAVCHITVEYIANGNYVPAFAIAENLVKAREKNYNIGLYLLGLCHATQGRLRQAENCINEFITTRKYQKIPAYVRKNLRTIQRALQKNKQSDYDQAAHRKIRQLRKQICLDIDRNLWTIELGQYTIVD